MIGDNRYKNSLEKPEPKMGLINYLSACDAQAGRRAIRGSVVDSLIPVML